MAVVVGAIRTAALQMIMLLAPRIMPRTTLDLDASVLEQLRKRAVTEHKSMGQVASERLAAGPDLLYLFWPTIMGFLRIATAHLAALMRQHGVRVIYTRYRDFRRYDGIDPRDPFS